MFVTTVAVFLSLSVASAEACPPPPSAAKIASLPTQYPLFHRALRKEFGRSWVQAAIVSWKEGSWHSWASNGQYQGTFQMGSYARSTYGHGPTLVHQVIAAAKYWRASGKDWSPWECKPY